MKSFRFSFLVCVFASGILLAQAPPPAPTNFRIIASVDAIAPTVSFTAPIAGATVSGVITVSVTATDNVGVAGVQFTLDGSAMGAEDTTSPYAVSWNTASAANGTHSLAARARDAAGNQTSAALNVIVSNAAGGLQIANIAAADSVPTYDKLEITFSVTGSVD